MAAPRISAGLLMYRRHGGTLQVLLAQRSNSSSSTSAWWRADLVRDDPSESVFVREVNERVVDSPWAAFVSLESFGKQIADLEVLASMVALSARSRTPVLAAIEPSLFGCASLVNHLDPRTWKPDPVMATAWETIRGMAPARFLGVVTPRFLLRLPYGKRAARTESFAFEEMPAANHDDFLWGSGTVACALLLAEGFVASGWNLDPDDIRQIQGLPVHVYDDEGESTVKPCAEVPIRESAVAAITEQGVMVLASIQDRDGVRLIRFQSAAQGTERLAGRW